MGPAFLERGLIEARFVKPVYDGETAEVTARRATGCCRSRSKAAASSARPAGVVAGVGALGLAFGFLRSRRGHRAQAGRMRRPIRSANGSAPCHGPGPAKRQGSIWQIFARPTRSTRRKARPSRPAAAGHEQGAGRQRHSRPLDSCRQPDAASAAARTGDEITARAKVTGNYEKKGHRFVELDALVIANGRTPLAHCQHTAIYQPRERAAACANANRPEAPNIAAR